MTALRVGFMGTPDFAVSPLKAIVEAGFDVVCVYNQPPRPKGRGHKVQNSPVHDYALSQNIPVFHPSSLKSEEAQQEFAAQDLDIAIVAAYGLILPQVILDAPKFGCINIHASLLPRWRGASPIQRAIWEGDAETGVTLMQMDRGLDTGDMIAQKPVPISNDTTTPQLHDQLSVLGADMVLETLQNLQKTQQKLSSKPQPDDGVTYAHLLKKEDGKIDWSQSAQQIDRQIRALNPWPGVWTVYDGKKFKIKNAALLPEASDKNPGEILDKSGAIACGSGDILQIKQLQPEAKSSMDFAAALNGGFVHIGRVWG